MNVLVVVKTDVSLILSCPDQQIWFGLAQGAVQAGGGCSGQVEVGETGETGDAGVGRQVKLYR